MLDGSKDTARRMEALLNFQEASGLNSDDKINDEKKLEELRLNFEKAIKDSQKQTRNLFFLFFVIFSLSIFAFWFYFRNREKQHFLEREKLLKQIKSLKKKLLTQSVAAPVGDKKILTLNKEKIEKAINNRLGESSWMILNLIFNNPSIGNKEIAEEISLSLEGVSSSLRRMYQAFEINSSSNKKITLIMKATRLSFED